MKTTDLKKETLQELVNFAIDKINDLAQSNIYGCDLHGFIFNQDYYIIGRYQAEQWLINNTGVFAAISEIQEYEKDNFGEVNTDLSEPEKVVNMYVYIAGEMILNESKHLLKKWNEKLTEKDCTKIVRELKKIIE